MLRHTTPPDDEVAKLQAQFKRATTQLARDIAARRSGLEPRVKEVAELRRLLAARGQIKISRSLYARALITRAQKRVQAAETKRHKRVTGAARLAARRSRRAAARGRQRVYGRRRR